MELAKTLSLFEGSDLIFISYGEEEEGEYKPHSKALRIEPRIELLEEAIKNTPQPNDFGIMPFKWKAKSEEDKTEILFKGKLSRWSEGELFAYGYLVIDRLLLDIDTGEISKETALKLARKLKRKGIGKVAYTGGGLLAVVELDGEIRVEERETFSLLRKLLLKSSKELISEVDPQSFNAGKGVRLVGTFSKKRGVNTEWILWEEGKKFDVCDFLFKISRETFLKAPPSLKESLEKKLGIKLGKGVPKRVPPEEVFKKAREFYGELDGRRNEFMLQLSGEMLRAGVEKEKVIELYLEYLSDLEKKDRPHQRIKQTIEYVYREKKEYFISSDYPKDFLSLVRSFRGEYVEEDWKVWRKRVNPESLFFLLRLLGEAVEENGRCFHLPSMTYIGRLRCIYEEDGDKKKGEIECTVYMSLPPCVERALGEYRSTKNGETSWILKHLLQVSFLLPDEVFEVKTEGRVSEFEDNPLVQVLKLISREKGIEPGEIREAVVKRTVLKESSGINLIRCINPLLKKHCSEDCRHYAFRSSLPRVLERTRDTKTRRVLYAKVSIEGKEVEIEGEFLNSLKQFSVFLEREGILLSPLVKEWLYEDILRSSKQEYIDEEKQRFMEEAVELFIRNPQRWIRRIDGKNLWIATSSFMELMTSLGYKVGRRNVGKIRERFGFKSGRTEEERFTLIPYAFFGDEDIRDILRAYLSSLRYILIPEGVEVEVVDEFQNAEERKLYVRPSEEGFEALLLGRRRTFKDIGSVRKWVETVLIEASEEDVEL